MNIWKNALMVFAIATLLQCNTTRKLEPSMNSFRLVAEYEPSEYVWLPFHEGPSDLGGPPAEDLTYELVRALSPHVKILFDVVDTVQYRNMTMLLQQQNIDLDRVDFFITRAHAAGALTDIAPLFLTRDDGELATVDFAWGCYGLVSPGDPRARQDGRFDRDTALEWQLPILDSSHVVLEGGGIEHNGKGTMLLVEQLAMDRNPGMTLPEIEKEHIEKLRLKKVIWLKKGPWEEEYKTILPGGIYPVGCGGHIDEFCRFVNDSTIMLAAVGEDERFRDSISAENYRRMEENYQILKNATDQDGRPFHIIRVPIPEPHIFEIKYEDAGPYYFDYFPGKKSGDTVRVIAASSYLNFLIANDVVVVAKYWKEGRSEVKRKKDEEVLRTFEAAFPGKTIVQIDMEGYNNGGGGIHCYSLNVPAAQNKRSRIIPLVRP